MADASSLVVVKSSGGGGIGDSIKSVLAGIDYAGRSGRSIHVDWADGMFGPEGENVFHRFFAVQGLPEVDDFSDWLDRVDVFPPIWRHHLDQSLKTLWAQQNYPGWDRALTRATFSFDQQRLDYQEGVLVMWDFDDFFSRPGALSKARYLGAQHLKPALDILAEVEDFASHHFTRPSIGIHVRDTKEARNDGKSTAVSMLLSKAIELGSKLQNPIYFVATDNQLRLRQCQQELPDVICRQKPMPAPGEAIHLVDFGPTAFEKTRDAFLDMMLLSRCDHMIYPAFSSFSASAAILSQAPMSCFHPITPQVSSAFANLPKRVWAKLRRSLNR